MTGRRLPLAVLVAALIVAGGLALLPSRRPLVAGAVEKVGVVDAAAKVGAVEAEVAAEAAEVGRRYVDDDPGCGGLAPCYASIQAAVDDSASGDLIRVLPGRYTETVLAEDRALNIEGPGAGDPAVPDDAAAQALWSTPPGAAGGNPAALTVDARQVDISGTAIAGFRFVSVSVGVLLMARQPGDPLPLPAGRPSSTVATRLVGAQVAGNMFRLADDAALDPLAAGGAARGAIVAMGADGLSLTGNRIAGGAGGIVVLAGSNPSLAQTRVERSAGDGVWVGRITGTLSISGLAVSGAAGAGVTLVDVPAQRTVQSQLDHNGVGMRLVTTRFPPLENAGAAAGRAGDGSASDNHGDDSDAHAGGAGDQHTDDTSTHISGVGHLRIDDSVVANSTLGDDGLGQVPALVIGGAPADGNDLADNLTAALVLENRTTGARRSPDVLATFNRWGSAYAPRIEALIRHQADDPRLGRVSFLPALGTPTTITLNADPAVLPADGSSEAVLAAAVTDAAGQPVADGTLVRLASDSGTLSAAGAFAEAEVLDNSGEWGTYTSPNFGPFSGGGFTRSRQPGSALRWSTNAPAVLVRYGQTAAGDAQPGLVGVFNVQVDGRRQQPVTTTGATTGWVELAVAQDLGPGVHAVTLTVQSGEVNVDLLASGVTTIDGNAAVRLRAAAAVGRGLVTALAYGADGTVAGALEVPFVPGPPAVLTLSSKLEVLPAGGVTTTVTADLRDRLGRPAGDGSTVAFSTTLGTVAPAQAVVHAGRAATVLASGTDLGTATVLASAGNLTATTAVSVVAGPPAIATLSAEPAGLPANSTATSELTLTVWDAWHHPVLDGTPVAVTTSLGTIEAADTHTLGGLAHATLRAGNVAGQAFVRGAAGLAALTGGAPDISGGSAVVALAVPLDPLDLRVVLTAEPSPPAMVSPGESVIYTVQFANVGQDTVYDVELQDLLPAAAFPHATLNYDGRVLLQSVTKCPACHWRIARLRPGEGTSIQIFATVDTGVRWADLVTLTNTASITSAKAAEGTPFDNVSSADVLITTGAAYTVTLEVPPKLPVGGASGKVVARVVDQSGGAVRDGTPVFFTTDMGSIDPAVVPTKNGTAEADFTTGTQAGEATVKAVSVDNRAGLARIVIEPGPVRSLEFLTSRDALRAGGETAALTATLQDAYGNPVPGRLVAFDADQGLLSAISAQTNGQGQAFTSLRSGVRAPLTATVTAHIDALFQTLAIPIQPGPVANVAAELAKGRFPVNAHTAVVATVEDAYGNPVAGSVVSFSTSFGTVLPRTVAADASGRALTKVWSNRPGDGTVRATAAGVAGGVTGVAAFTVEAGPLYLPWVWRSRR